ncbi:hypothetical protein BC936DRAFT_147849 [Jimgerdemannia flammicorona]|uniref:Uncharacterized protein n=1 Tax=Jimgerdemannia flammicorona TaxID=994334 RepID=A0A433D4E2_9FUNG|nr:hypothetical protein BC936DRAFT_147849 [Jimgerdemannia flammicorona]
MYMLSVLVIARQFKDCLLCPPYAYLAVGAQMKFDKTRKTCIYIDSYFPAKGRVPSAVRFVTFRQTFGHSLASQFPDFTLYSTVKGDLAHIRHLRLIIQTESRIHGPLT